MTLAKGFPHLRFCIQDRPKTVEHGITVGRFPYRTSVYSLDQPRCGKSGVLRCWNQGGQRFKVSIPRPGGVSSAYPHRTVHDFFTPQPVQNAAVFLLRMITHDWPDESVTRILLQLRHAATPQTKLVVLDYILPLACEDHTGDVGVIRTLAPSSSGLLPNLGKANSGTYSLDMTVSHLFLLSNDGTEGGADARSIQ